MITTVTSKGQVTIPADLREKYGLTPGTRVRWVERSGGIEPRPVDAFLRWRGAFKGEPSLVKDLLADRKLDRLRGR